MEFSVLGPVSASLAGEPVLLGPPKQRLLFAILLLEPGRVVSLDRLYELLWPDQQPQNTRTTVQIMVSRLRSILLAATGDDRTVRIHTRPPGYLLEVDPQLVDVHRFRTLVERAQGSGSTVRRAELLRAALAQWRGAALADVATDAVRDRLCAGLTEHYWQAVEDRVDADLRLGRHAELLVELRDHVAEQPLRERLVGALMLALHRLGRQSHAIGVFDRLRRRLADELGLDPGPEVRALHEAVLSSDAGPPGVDGTRWSPPEPAQLPPDPVGFVGRDSELSQLDAALGSDGDGRAVIVNGPPGVGKTTVAIRWAHTRRPLFPDGVLHADLRGYQPGQEVGPGTVLDRFLRGLGVPGAQVPADHQTRVDLYRSMLAGRRVLIVLDNVTSAATVRLLLPTAPGCGVLIISRERLSGLAARDGIQRVDVDVLDPDTARSLLCTALGGRDHDSALLDDVARLCDRLPLALRIAAGRITADSAYGIESLVRDLSSAEHRLNVLRLNDDLNLADAFVGSYDALTPGAANLFHHLSLLPGPLPSHAVAVLADTSGSDTRAMLAELIGAHLAVAAGPDRYGIHDLLRGFARSRSRSTSTEVALRRLAVSYLDTALDAAHSVTRDPTHDRMRGSERPSERLVFHSEDEGMRWLESERDLLFELIQTCSTRGWHDLCWRLVNALFSYLDRRVRFDRRLELARIGLASAEACEEEYGVALLSRSVGMWAAYVGELEFQHFDRALRFHRMTFDRFQEAHDQACLGLAYACAGDHELAQTNQRAALTIFRDLGNVRGQLLALNNLGVALGESGSIVEAVRTLRTGIDLSERTTRESLGALYGNLAEALFLLGELDEAREFAVRGRQVSQLLGRIASEASALVVLSDCLSGQDSQTALQEALRLYQTIGHPRVAELRTRLASHSK